MSWILKATRESDDEELTFTYDEEVFARKGHEAIQRGGYRDISLEES